MKNTEKLFLVNGIWLVYPENSSETGSLEKLCKRQKLFVKFAKRFMMGPVLGVFSISLLLMLQVATWASFSSGIIVMLLGLFIPFKFIKHSYWLFLLGLYLFLASQILTKA